MGKKLGIFDFLYAYNLSRKSFQPPATDRIVSVSVSSNMVADAFEAVIGSFDINGGFDLAFQVVRKAFMSVAKMESTDKDVIADIKRYLVLKKFDKYIEEIAVIYNEKCPDIACEFINTRDIEKSINYVFKNKSILVEALTHPSSSNTFVKRSYERLEFLGDALLGYIIARKIFLKYGTYPPGPMSLLKGNLVNNRFLSLISYNLGIHKHMDHTASSIFSTVGKMAEQIQEIDIDSFGIKSTPKGTPDHNPDLPWCNMEYSKSLSDVYESIVGAVYIDSGLNLKEAESFIDRTLYNPWIWRFDNAQIVTENMEKTPTEKFSEYKRTCLDIDEVERILDDNSVCFKVVCHDILVAEATATRKRVAREHCIMKALEYFEDNPTFCTCH